MDQTLNIGAFSQRCGISISALRFYDQCGLLVPTAVDNATAYRLYGETQVEDAELLRDLRRLDLSIEQIREFQAASTEQRAGLIAAQVSGFGTRLQQIQATARSLRTRIHGDGKGMQVDAVALAGAIDQVLPAVSTDRSLPALQAVLLEAREGSLRLVATDKYRLVVRDLNPHPPAYGVFRVLVPAAAIEELRTALTDGLVSVEPTATGLVIRTDQGDHELPASDAEFPAYEKILMAELDGRQLLSRRDALLAALEPVIEEEYVELTFTNGALLFDGTDGISVPATFDGDPIDLAIRPSYMRDAVVHSIGPEVSMDVTSAVSPVVFRSADDGSYTCMVMPIRVGPAAKKGVRKAPVG